MPTVPSSRFQLPSWALLPLALLTACGGSPSGESARGADEQVVERRADPPSELLTANGKAIPVFRDFDRIKGLFNHQNDTTYVINFWATWCKPCVAEMPFFERLHDQFEEEKLRVVLVSLDFEQALKSDLVPFLEERNLRSDVLVLLDGNYNDWVDQVSADWTGAIPVTLVYRAGERQVHNNSFNSYEQLETMVREVL